MKQTVSAWLIWLLVSLLSCCVRVNFGPEPPSYYETWWKIVETCSHHQADYSQWTFVTSKDDFGKNPQVPSADYNAQTYVGWHTIVVSSLTATCGKIVRHEMLHAIDTAYNWTHPDSIYRKCAGIVAEPIQDWRDC